MIETYAFELAGIGLAGFAVGALAGARLYYGPQFSEVPWVPLRRAVIPVAHRIAQRQLGDDFYAVYDVGREEHVITLELSVEDAVDDLEIAGYLPEPLAAFKTDWNGNTEAASYARHIGSKPFPGAPEWLRERQIHVTLFDAPDGGTIVTAHEEWNSWRWDKAEAHYRGETMDIEKGVALAAKDLDVVPTSN